MYLVNMVTKKPENEATAEKLVCGIMDAPFIQQSQSLMNIERTFCDLVIEWEKEGQDCLDDDALIPEGKEFSGYYEDITCPDCRKVIDYFVDLKTEKARDFLNNLAKQKQLADEEGDYNKAIEKTRNYINGLAKKQEAA